MKTYAYKDGYTYSYDNEGSIVGVPTFKGEGLKPDALAGPLKQSEIRFIAKKLHSH